MFVVSIATRYRVIVYSKQHRNERHNSAPNAQEQRLSLFVGRKTKKLYSNLAMFTEVAMKFDKLCLHKSF